MQQFLPLISSEKQDAFKKALNSIQTPFAGVETEYKFLKKLKENNLYSEPHLFKISSQLDETFIRGHPTLMSNTIEGCMCDMRFHLKKYFETPNVLKETLQNIDKIRNTEKLTHFIQGDYWKSKSFGKKTVFPIFLYLDAFQINDPLGAHQSSVVVIYYSIILLLKKQKAVTF